MVKKAIPEDSFFNLLYSVVDRFAFSTAGA
jgi:hypothetical protein